MSDYITEINNFCKYYSEGALLFKGEWGCGKSYFINEVLLARNGSEDVAREELLQCYIPIKVSLFGIESVSELHKAIKTSYIKAKYDFSDKHVLEKFINITKGAASKLLKASGVDEAALDFSEYIEYKQINGKKLLFIFDDLERCTIDAYLLLGVINEYIVLSYANEPVSKVIIIANEDRIGNFIEYNKEDANKNGNNGNNENDRKISKYIILKEKLISKELLYSVNLTNIIEYILSDYNKGIYLNYFNFLMNNRDTIIGTFSESGCKNIRRLKCALQNYFRFYKILIEKTESSLQNIDDTVNLIFTVTIRWYLMLYMSKDFSQMLSDKEGDSGALNVLEAYTRWIKDDFWDKKGIVRDIDILLKKYTNHTPKNKLLYSTNLLCIEDNDFLEGIEVIAKCAYNGELSYDEYVRLLLVNAKMREDEICPTFAFDLEKVKNGINKKNKEKLSIEDDYYTISVSRHELDETEQEVYSHIKRITQKAKADIQKKVYIDLCAMQKEEEQEKVCKYRFEELPEIDDDIIKVWYGFFSKANNNIRNRFISWFENNELKLARNEILQDENKLKLFRKQLEDDMKNKKAVSQINYKKMIEILKIIEGRCSNSVSIHPATTMDNEI